MRRKIPFRGDEQARLRLRKQAAERVRYYMKIITCDQSLSRWAAQGVDLLNEVIRQLDDLGDDLSLEALAYVRASSKAPRGMRMRRAERGLLMRIRSQMKHLAVEFPRTPEIDAKDAVDEEFRLRGYSREEISIALDESLAALDRRRNRRQKKALPPNVHGYIEWGTSRKQRRTRE